MPASSHWKPIASNTQFSGTSCLCLAGIILQTYYRPSHSSYCKRPWVLQWFSTFTFLCTNLHKENSAFPKGLLGSVLHSYEAEAPGHFCLTIILGRLIPALCTGRNEMHWLKRGSDQLADSTAKELLPSHKSKVSIFSFCLEHALGTQTSCKRSSGLQKKDFTEQRGAKAGSLC